MALPTNFVHRHGLPLGKLVQSIDVQPMMVWVHIKRKWLKRGWKRSATLKRRGERRILKRKKKTNGKCLSYTVL